MQREDVKNVGPFKYTQQKCCVLFDVEVFNLLEKKAAEHLKG